jgi:glycosyltransferase involved in cell wall biosynthesis
MLVPHPGIRGPIPAIAALVGDGLIACGCEVKIQPWGRHSDNESRGQKVLGRAMDVLRVLGALRRYHPDVVLVHTAHDAVAVFRDLPLLAVARLAGTRVVLHLHGSSPQLLAGSRLSPARLGSSALARLASGLLVLSREEQAAWQKWMPELRVGFVTNPYRRSHPDVDRPRRAGKLRLLFVGRLLEQKGVLDLIRALPMVRQATEQELVVAGTGPAAEKVGHLARCLGLEQHVRLAGYVEGSALRELYAAADVFVLPTWWNEGFPTVLAEAMDAGLAIVTTPTRGAADHLRDGVNALLVPPRNPPALAAAIVRLAQDPQLQRQMGRANQAKVGDFAPDIVGPLYFRALTDVLRSQPADSKTQTCRAP